MEYLNRYLSFKILFVMFTCINGISSENSLLVLFEINQTVKR